MVGRKLSGEVRGRDEAGGLTVEIWDAAGPPGEAPDAVPIGRLDDLSSNVEKSLTDAFLTAVSTDADGSFHVDLDAVASDDAVYLRVFDRGRPLAAERASIEERPGEPDVRVRVDSSADRATASRTAAAVVPLLAVNADQSDGETDAKEPLNASVADYADENGVVRTDGLREAVDDWRTGDIDTDLLREVVDAWRTGEPVVEDSPDDPELRDPEPPEPDSTRSSTVDSRSRFLYTGEDPVQRDVDPEDIDDRRVCTLTGRVTERVGTPLSGVIVRINGRPEFGWSATREDGRYDMVVNGGGRVTVAFDKEGYLPAQRSVNVAGQQETALPEVALVPLDGEGTEVEMDADEPQVVEGTESQDEDGTRRAVVFVPPETAGMWTDDGTAPQSLEVHTAEYTVGDRGPQAMPAQLPPQVGYTYASEFLAQAFDDLDGSGSDGGIDPAFIEADAEGDLRFDRPVIFYLENFLEFPVGTPVPVGAYDREDARWFPSDDGLVLEVLDIVDGAAVLDLTGDGSAADEEALADHGIGDAERERLADRYEAGQELWRTPLPHFTPWDCNWTVFPPDDAVPPLPEIPEIERVLEETPPEPPSPPKGESPEEREDDNCDC